jgi:hypothetical protein
MPETKYDFEFITLSLGLLPICGGTAAISLAQIVDLEKIETGWTLRLNRSGAYKLTDGDMAELEQTIRRRSEAAREIQKENYKSSLRAQAEAAAELNAGVAPGGIVLGSPRQRFKPQ